MAVKRSVTIQLNYTNSDKYKYESFLNRHPEFVTPIKKDVTIENAYCKLMNLYGNKDGVEYQMGVYTSDGSTLVMSETYEFIPDGNEESARWDKQAYWNYKNRYDDAVDILEDGQTS